eukprot:c3633_g1_i1.p1 GENE.c3633_g1_i1~~c3633_g1_i1.p1  ORF type:complete len:448 (+),score=118.14 c3633_g1_i1:36-1379(+)
MLFRASRVCRQIDAKFVAANPQFVIENLAKRRITDENSIQSIHRVCHLTQERTNLTKERDDLLHSRNTISNRIGLLIRSGLQDQADAEKSQVENINAKVSEISTRLTAVESETFNLVSRIPNILDANVPIGKDDTENEVVSVWGEDKRKLGTFLWHDQLLTNMGAWDPEAASRMSGARFSVLRGKVAQLHRALSAFMLDLHVNKHGYQEVTVPFLVSRSTLEGTGHLPKFEMDLFRTNHKVAGEDSFLIPTAEVPLTSLVRGQLLERSDLPLSFVSLSQCFRAEAGSYGRDTRGLMRLHQFSKVELVRISSVQDSETAYQQMTQHCEAVLQALELPYRKVRLCSGDVGFSAKHCFDLEVWTPGAQCYREVSSISNCGSFQAQRMGLRYRSDPDNKKAKEFCHTMNGSGLAIERTLIALLEQHQQPDGTVAIPEVLKPYLTSHVNNQK